MSRNGAPRLNIPERNAEMRLRAVQAYAEGVELALIAERFRVCSSTVRRWAQEDGVERVAVRLTKRSKPKTGSAV